MKVKVYTTTTCPYCKMQKDYLDSKGVKYENFFVDQDPDKAQEMMDESGQMGVPVIDIDGKLIIGFDEKAKEEVKKALGL